MPTIRVREETLKALNIIKGFLMTQEGHYLSHDDVIQILFMSARFSPENFTHWQIFEDIKRMKRWELKRVLEESRKRLKNIRT